MLDNQTKPLIDPVEFYGRSFSSRLMLGTARYPSPDILHKAYQASGAEIVTVSLRREMSGGAEGHEFLQFLRDMKATILPNTAGCRSVKEAITTAQMARELFQTAWIKLEVIANDDTLQPDVTALVEATKLLSDDGFQVFPYTTEDLSVAEKLLQSGAEVIMPWGSPIGSGLGLNNLYGLKTLRAYLPDTPLIVDAGIGAPSHAAHALELGYDAILLNTAVARATDPIAMAEAFKAAIQAGRQAYRAGLMEPQEMASPSTPVAGTPFFDLNDDGQHS